MPRKWYDAEVIAIKDLAPKVKSFKLKIEDEDTFEYQAGQFIVFDLPTGEKRLDRWRSYSIASPPSDDYTFELCLVHLENGKGSKYFFEEVKVGTILKTKPPEGSFLIPSNTNQTLVMICTGTGIAPFRSMIHDIYTRKLPFKKVHLIFGTRTFEDVLYFEEFTALAKKNESFQYDIALSREQSTNFHSGYVHHVYEREYGQGSLDTTFLICGWSNMVDEASKNLTENLKYSQNNVIFELFG
jgi:CDP-4-dehydro-6-deoxyglucose reductase